MFGSSFNINISKELSYFNGNLITAKIAIVIIILDNKIVITRLSIIRSAHAVLKFFNNFSSELLANITTITLQNLKYGNIYFIKTVGL